MLITRPTDGHRYVVALDIHRNVNIVDGFYSINDLLWTGINMILSTTLDSLHLDARDGWTLTHIEAVNFTDIKSDDGWNVIQLMWE